MPVLVTSAYVTVESATNLIRAIINDMLLSTAGEIFTDNANFAFPLLNDSLEWFQNEVNNHGITTFEKETFLTGITPAVFNPANDPGQQVNISDTGYFDGTNNNATPQVPVDLLVPLRLWERQTGSSDNWSPMAQRPDGLPSQTPSDRFSIWEWRQDGLYMPGATQTNDLRLRYTGSHALLATVNDTLLFRGAVGPIAYKTAAVFLSSKNPDAAKAAAAEAIMRVSQLSTRSARMKQREVNSRRSYGSPRSINRFRPPVNP